jgi:hypothetical protein
VSFDDSAMKIRRRTVTALPVAAFALVALAAPAVASASIYEVNSTGDQADETAGNGICKTSVNTCTLRAAVEESDESAGVHDAITFAVSFNGELADTIVISGSFPVIDDAVTIDGDAQADELGQCEPLAGVLGPCVGVEKSGGGFGLVVEDDEVTIEGLAVTGALTGIDVINGSEEFAARDNWIGVKLDGSAGANNTGIFIDPESNGAAIGGTVVAARNVIADNNLEGLDIEGASGAVVRGNYFGVTPKGTSAAPNAKDIEVTDSTSGSGFKAIGNEIGANVGVAAATPACDGGCNVISGATAYGIDLQGIGANEAPPSGPTTIHGNYIGLSATGSAAIANGLDQILVGGADETLIGGNGIGDANHINGGEYGVLAGKEADDLVVDGNLIGLNPAGTAILSPPSVDAIFDSSEGISNSAAAAEITDNRIALLGGTAIEQHSLGALIARNQIGRGAGGQSLSAGTTGIKLWAPSVSGSAIEENVIENPTGNGVLIENENNTLTGNEIVAAGAAGVRIQNFLTLPTTGTLIGGDSEEDENAISESEGDAIEVVDEEDDDTQIARNHGAGNSGLFIDLGADGPGNEVSGPNDGIQPPTISTATVSGASGAGARPGATVRVFRKASASPGELLSFLGKATADGEGKWSLAYGAAIPGGTNIAATQSDIEGTSELAFAVTSSPPPACTSIPGAFCGASPENPCPVAGATGCGGAPCPPSGGSKCGGKGKGKDKKAPETTIVKGPRRTHRRTVKFKFVSSEPGSTFQCKLDHRKLKPCRSPKRYRRLEPGKHVFKVRAIDAAGNVDKTPAKRKFRVLP